MIPGIPILRPDTRTDASHGTPCDRGVERPRWRVARPNASSFFSGTRRVRFPNPSRHWRGSSETGSVGSYQSLPTEFCNPSAEGP